MKIATVTLNPAIDQTVMVNSFQVGAVNRSLGMRLDAGGKGVNVASFLADYGLDVVVTGLLGKENTTLFENRFAKKKIEDQFIRVAGETRTNIKIQDEATKETTDLNTAGQVVEKEALGLLNQKIYQLAEDCDWIVLSGNLPQGLPTNFYAELIQSLKGKKSAVMLDTSGEALREGVKANPWMIKPNLDEFRELTGKDLKEISEIYAVARNLINSQLQLIVVSMGAQGALFVQSDEAFLAVPPTVSPKSSVGAGDALLAGLIAGLSKNMSLIECAKLAVSFSLSAITQLERNLHSLSELEVFQKNIVITPLEIQQLS